MTKKEPFRQRSNRRSRRKPLSGTARSQKTTVRCGYRVLWQARVTNAYPERIRVTIEVLE